MDRMPKFDDNNSKQTSFGYGVEGRRTSITHPNPEVNPVTTQAGYDIMGRLVSLETTQGSNQIRSWATSMIWRPTAPPW